jgi:hypothetical protein
MLKDRRELIEHDIAQLTKQCSKTYLEIIRGFGIPGEFKEYNEQITKLSNLQSELRLINTMIREGHK